MEPDPAIKATSSEIIEDPCEMEKLKKFLITVEVQLS